MRPISDTGDRAGQCFVTMQDGKLVLVKEDELYLLNSPIVFWNGNMILMDGTVQFSNGAKGILREGEILTEWF